MIKTTLQARLVILMVISFLFLTSVFTFIQLNNQLQGVREFNIYRAKQGALQIRDKLQNIFLNMPAEKPRSQVVDEIEKVLGDLVESGAIETAVVLDNEGNPVVLQGKLSLVFEEKKKVLGAFSEREDKSRWLVPVIDKEHRLISLFVAVDNPYGFSFKLTFSLGNLQEALNQVYGPVILTIIIVIIANIALALSLSRALIKPVKVLNQATKDIAAGDLERKVLIRTQDELEELADTFNYMTVELKKMKEKAENANPLTKLPGNIVIREETEKRIREGKKFVLIYADLDNFKAFNDKHGMHSGDGAIMLTANIIKEAVAREGKEGDFIGHEGGDDFLLLTTPERAKRLADYIIREFDQRIRSLYAKEELEKGYIEAPARDSEEIKRFPIMTISLVGMGNYLKPVSSYAQLTNIAAELKRAAKKVQKSNFILDRRIREPGAGAEFRQQA